MMCNLKPIIFSLLFVVLSLAAYSSDSSTNQLNKNIVYATYGGYENRGSLNFEHVFSMRPKWNWSYSAGVQPFSLPGKFAVPLSVNAFTAGKLHHFELGVGANFYRDKFHPYNGGFGDDYNKQLFVSTMAGYRLQGSKGIVLKAMAGPRLLLDPPSNDVLRFRSRLLGPAVFFSLGYSF